MLVLLHAMLIECLDFDCHEAQSSFAEFRWIHSLDAVVPMVKCKFYLLELKQICYPRSKLIERQRLSKRAFGWIVLAEAPSLDNLVRRYRMLSLTAAERLGLTSSQKPGSSHSATHFEYYSREEPLPVVGC
ncbi:Tyrosine-protein kinase transmembrane receptor Ror2 [Fasciola hepatica]|uniref:Tyrosine-protein kinase transmembrane receptor Ror2 n=1 Tax=Fasciola hepatica TaxID=6192 RepID=A0A4E0QU95_FASHE|nr:Tyrosine-protein kinase transmembrane receptor Ror2 [Fasciola hepatica]